MKNAKSLLDGLLGGAGGPGGMGETLSDMAGRAKGAWDGQSALTKGAVAGGLLALLMGGKGTRQLAGSALKVGGAAVLGGLAWQAWQGWQAGKTPAEGAGPLTPPAPGETPFLPADPEAADDLSARLLQAMVAAAKADGHVTEEERDKIAAHLGEMGLAAEAQAMIAAELDAPLDAGRIAALARGPEEAAEIYAASLLVVDPEAPAEKGYLAMLAARLDLDAGLVAHLHARTAELA
jgi:uncharacterized membrane protein YebE (DUF533 family)